MFDIGIWELALIGVLALVILGPHRLPEVARTAGKWVGRMRQFVASVKSDFMPSKVCSKAWMQTAWLRMLKSQ
jgi:Tat protein translocase TatB subunit